jgi:hypothetical protein
LSRGFRAKTQAGISSGTDPNFPEGMRTFRLRRESPLSSVMPDGALRRIRFAFLTGASAPDGRIRETAKKRLDRSFPEIIGNNKREF